MESNILKGEKPERSLNDLVLSWSLNDVLNNNLYKGQVKQIPKTFPSYKPYLDSFIDPLIEETRCALCSSLSTLSESLCSEIESVEKSDNFDLKNGLFLYSIRIREYFKKNRNNDSDDDDYDEDNEHKSGDIVAITNVKPKWFGDLDRPGWPYLVALVDGVFFDEYKHEFKLSVKSSRPIYMDDPDYEISHKSRRNKKNVLYAVKLMRMTTVNRIWSALKSNPETGNFNIINNVLQNPFVDTEDCSVCLVKDEEKKKRFDALSSDLNESQKAAVLKCIATKECCHKNSVKLIWGPPGTGKTKTVGFLLNSLLDMKCRTLTCAPTNIAVLEVTKRLVSQVSSLFLFGGYGLGDVVLLGNKKRVKIKRHPELYDVFIDHRVKVLKFCFLSETGWNANLLSMISLLDDPDQPYQLYLRDRKPKTEKDSDKEEKEDETIENLGSKNMRSKRESKDSSKDKRNRKKPNSKETESSREKELKQITKGINDHLKGNKKKNKNKIGEPDQNEEIDEPLSFEEFVRTKFEKVVQRLYFCIDNLYIHLPRSNISLDTVKNMFTASSSLERFEDLFHSVTDEELKKAFGRESGFENFNSAREKSLADLKSLPLKIRGPDFSESYIMDIDEVIRLFCLENSILIFCTVSGSATLHSLGSKSPLEMLVIDEAAQLKECESAIPLQLSGIRHAILIGDEKQLPAMVQSKMSERADFGRSLFERLALLGHKKLLLNVQHRMNPSISAFPNREFYGNMILDGHNVKLETYRRSFLKGEMFGSYSFINVPHGKEEFDRKHSRKNMTEVDVVANIVSSLYKEYLQTKKKIRLGVISPYKAQVHALDEKFGKRYSSDAESEFSLSVRSVDGFQGGEEDLIIISTVRCNVGGSVGFLSNLQRTNVALTRARYCLWIVGSGTTLGSSNSVWNKVVTDAKVRQCFHNAEDDQNLAQAIIASLLDHNQFDVLSSANSLLFESTAKWKVCFDVEFWRSMGRAKDDLLRKKVFSLLKKLSSGWREPTKNEVVSNSIGGSGTSTLFVEYYEVAKQTYLVWAVDVFVERNSVHSHKFMKVWDVLALKDAPKLTKRLDAFYGGYTLDKMRHCNHKLTEGDLVVPMRWPVDSALELSKPLESLSLSDDKSETSSIDTRKSEELP